MSYCLSPHDRDVLQLAYDERDWEAVRVLLAIDVGRQLWAKDNGFTPSERRQRDAAAPFDRERDEGDAA